MTAQIYFMLGMAGCINPLPDRSTGFTTQSSFFDVMGQVDAFMFAAAAFGVGVVGKYTFRMDQIATPWTAGVLVESGKQDFVVTAHFANGLMMRNPS